MLQITNFSEQWAEFSAYFFRQPESILPMSQMSLENKLIYNSQLLDDYQIHTAQAAIKAVFDETRNLFGEDSKQHAQAQMQMGTWHLINCDYAAAETLLKQAVQTLRRHRSGKRDLELAEALYWLGSVMNIQANLNEAWILYQEAYETLPNEAHNTLLAARIEMSQGFNLMMQGKFDKSLQKHEHAAALLESNYGMDYFFTAYAYTHVAMHYRQQGYYKEAQSILSHTTKTLGDTHPYAAIALREWAMTCDLLNEHDLARQLLDRAEKILLKSVGEQHAFYADLLTVLATHNQFHGNLTQAQNQWNHALFIYLDLYDENHPQVQFVIRMLVNILINQQNGDNQ